MKPGSLFNDGLQPVVYSEIENKNKGQSWIRAGFNIRYYKGNFIRDGLNNRQYYTLTFKIKTFNDGDTIYFAHSFPYTYT